MSYSTVLNIGDEIESLKNELVKTKKEILHCPDGYLNIASDRGNKFYYHKQMENGKRIREGIGKNPAILAKLCRKAYLEKKAAILEQDIQALKSIQTKFITPSAKNILSTLHKRYADLPREYFLKSIDDINAESGEISLRGGNAWAHAKFDQDKRYPEGKVIPVGGDVFVRSKSEALIARELIQRGVPFHYEEIVHIPGSKSYFVPDFTIRRSDGKIFYWEHFGLINDNNYLQNHARKLIAYEGLGITPWDNFIATYDRDGIIDIKEVGFIIENRLIL